MVVSLATLCPDGGKLYIGTGIIHVRRVNVFLLDALVTKHLILVFVYQERLQIIQGAKPRDTYEELSVDYYQTGSHKNYLKSWINDEIAVSHTATFWHPLLSNFKVNV